MTYMSNVDADRELDAVAKTRATWLRVLIDWHLVEPMPGAFDWGYVEHWINGPQQRGLNVLGLIAYTPDWARAPGSYFSAPPVDPSTYAAFAAKVAQRYGDRVTNYGSSGTSQTLRCSSGTSPTEWPNTPHCSRRPIPRSRRCNRTAR